MLNDEFKVSKKPLILFLLVVDWIIKVCKVKVNVLHLQQFGPSPLRLENIVIKYQTITLGFGLLSFLHNVGHYPFNPFKIIKTGYK